MAADELDLRLQARARRAYELGRLLAALRLAPFVLAAAVAAIACGRPFPVTCALAALHTRGYLSLNGQSSHGSGQSSPQGSLQSNPVPAHPSAGNAIAASNATHLSFMSASSPRPRTARGLHLL